MTVLNIIWSTLMSLAIVLIPIIGKLWVNKNTAKLKLSLSKEEFGHQIRFNREFNIYQFLWKKLATLTRESQLLTSSGYYSFNGKDTRSQDFGKALSCAYSVLDNNIPFYSQEVYEPAKKILDVLNDKTSYLRIALRTEFKNPEIKHFEEAQKAIEEMRPLIGEVEKAIRRRIYSDKENNQG